MRVVRVRRLFRNSQLVKPTITYTANKLQTVIRGKPQTIARMHVKMKHDREESNCHCQIAGIQVLTKSTLR